MVFEIIEKDWYKRRPPNTTHDMPLSVTIHDYKEEHNHFCNMEVTYVSGAIKNLIARVLFNPQKSMWTVDGMEVSVRVIK
jgi:hypothetical protein